VPWNNRISYPLNQTSVVANAPERSGVYVLSSKTTWVYIGEAESIRAQLVRWIFSAGSAPTVIGASTMPRARTTASSIRRMGTSVEDAGGSLADLLGRPTCHEPADLALYDFD